MMHVLNVDLDFFLDGRLLYVGDDSEKNRPDDHSLVPWEQARVQIFLEQQLGLDAKRKVPGTVVSSHHEVFFEWRRLIRKGKLTKPFYVTHVDAHADLGMGDASWTYILCDLLLLQPGDRDEPKVEGSDGLDFGNYFGFAIVNRWIKGLDFVINENWHDDIPRHYLTMNSIAKLGTRAEYASYSLEVELKRITREGIERFLLGCRIEDFLQSVGEPIVPLNIIPTKDLGNSKSSVDWDFAFLAKSPGYTPKSADQLIPIIGNYLSLS